MWFLNRPGGSTGRRVHPEVRAFHAGLPGYSPTPLVPVDLGFGSVLVKDETARLGLPAFKGLGASWAIERVLRERAVEVVVTATEGNHGRAVARMARLRGLRARVVVPEGVHPAAVAAIRDEGAEVVAFTGHYDGAVERAAALADEPGAVLVQDTALPGYTDVPGWVVAGYSTLFAEVDEQLGRAPDLVLVPAGVGSLAQAAVEHYERGVVAVEPTGAACVQASLRAGEPVTVRTSGSTMTGLVCGTVSALAWPLLRDGLAAAVAVEDAEARWAQAGLTAAGVPAGPCGAAALAGARAVLTDPDRRAALGLGPDPTVVALCTEGAAANPGTPPR